MSTGRGAESIRSLLSAPYHALDLLTAALDVGISVKSSDDAGTTGSGGPRTIAQYNFGLQQTAFAQHPGAEEIRTYPCNGTTGTAFELKNESPNPIPGRDLAANPIGQPIIIAVRPGQLVEITSATMVKKSDLTAIALRPTMTCANDPNSHLDPSRAIILPDVPPEPNTEYTVSIAGTNTAIADFNNGHPVSSGTNPAITSNATGAFMKTFTFKMGS
ncbi:hypothetical protein AB4142_25625 [Variovorax sp. 2RAF20]|uniref:hypothetical protein n=1 Tax=Variovorax sp. CF313 TaxID=1144315 RepID=UPI00027110E4|nr:hypothetical protein [Variovorax sp. CF313]EJL79289.1 hypothetical protein PMI12_00729 [Variovorax sp. CF313]